MIDLFGRKTVISTRFRSVFLASMAAMCIAYILMLTDNIVAGQVIGKEAVAAMTLVFPLVTTLLFISYVISDGMVMMMSYAQGRTDREEVNRLYSMGVFLSLVSGLIFFLILMALREEILSFWEISEEMMGYAREYYSGMVLLPLVLFFNIFNYTVFMAEGREHACVIASSLSFVVNIALSILLCNFIGIYGIAIATVAGYLSGICAQLYFLTGGRSQLRLRWYWNWKKVLQGLWYSLYHSIDTLLLSAFPMLLSQCVLRSFGEEHIIMVTVAMNLLTLIIALFTGMVDCLQPMVCQYHAEKNTQSVQKTMDIGMRATVALSLGVTVLGILFADFLPALFGVKDEGMTAEIAKTMRFFLLFTIFLGSTLMYSNYYIYIEERNYGAFIKCMLLLVLPSAGMYLGAGSSVNTLWLGVGGGYAAAFLLNLFLTRLWKGRSGLLLLDESLSRRQLSYDLNASFEEVMEMTRQADKDMKALHVEGDVRNKLVLFLEELGLHAVERAGDHPFQLECSVLLGDGNAEASTVIIRDNGAPYDVFHMEEKCTFRSYFIESVTSKIRSRTYLASGDENRIVLRL